MRVLVVDSALARCTAAVVRDGAVLAERTVTGQRGQLATLAVLVGAALRDATMPAASLDLVAVTVGPGSFTGVRAGLALAEGIAAAVGVPAVGVTVGEAIADALPRLGARALWVAIGARRGRFFLGIGGAFRSVPLDGLPSPSLAQRIAIAGDAAPEVAARLAARGNDVMLTDARLPAVRSVALVAARRAAGVLPTLPLRPLYVDAPEASLPAGGLRPPPG